MLSLDDPLWPKLQHAYGSAADIPGELACLTRKKSLPRNYWNDLWSSLCHQYCVDTASYAAFPHLVDAAGKLGAKDRFDAMSLAAGILACSGYNGKSIPKMDRKLSKPFRQAIEAGRKVLAEMASEKRKSTEKTLIYLAMIAAFDGHPQLTGLMWAATDGFGCPDCDAYFDDPAETFSPF